MFGYKQDDFDKKVYEEELKEFLPKVITDVHMHMCERHSCFDHQLNNPDKWVFRVGTYMPYEDMLDTYKGLFPDQKIIPILTGNPTGYLKVSNDYTAEIMKKTGLHGTFCTGCDMTDEYIEEEVLKGGFDGLKPYCDNCPPHLNKLDVDIYDFMPESQFKLADKYGWKVILHISKRDRIKNPDNVKRLLEIEQKYPNAKVILAHIGRAYSPEDLGDALEVLGKNTKNLTVDFSANVSDEALRRCIEAFGIERVMFGTDLPVSKMKMYRISENGNYVNVIPRGAYGDVSGDPHMRETDGEEMTNFVYEMVRCFKRVSKDLTLTSKDIEDIMCNNTAKLFGIKL